MTALPPPEGYVDGKAFRLPIRVYYEDTDAGGIVYHARYLAFAERARTEFLRAVGWPHLRMQRETSCFWAVRRLTADYVTPARLDDALLVTTTMRRCKGASVEIHQAVERDGEALVRLDIRLALLSLAGRPARMPAPLRQALLPFLASEESPTEPCKSMP